MSQGIIDLPNLYIILQGTAQRFALPASGRAWIHFEGRENSKRGKC